jgi:hypothetical protein
MLLCTPFFLIPESAAPDGAQSKEIEALVRDGEQASGHMPGGQLDPSQQGPQQDGRLAGECRHG